MTIASVDKIGGASPLTNFCGTRTALFLARKLRNSVSRTALIVVVAVIIYKVFCMLLGLSKDELSSTAI